MAKVVADGRSRYRIHLPLRRRGSRRGFVLFLAAVLAGTGTVAVAGMNDPDPGVPEDLRDSVLGLFDEGTCVTTTDAVAMIRERLRALDHEEWAIEIRGGAAEAGCAGVGFDATERSIIVLPAQPPRLREALQGIAEASLSRCLGRAELTAMISSTVTTLGIQGWTVRSDGPLAYPSGQEAEVAQHVASGCYIYSGSGHGADGQPVFYISGEG